MPARPFLWCGGLHPHQQDLEGRFAVEAGEVGFRGDPFHLADRPAGLGGAAGELLGPGVAAHLGHVVAADQGAACGRGPQGGLEEGYMPANAPKVTTSELLGAFESAETQIDRQRSVLEGLYQVLEGMALQEEILPSSRPVKKGYISSRFGTRRDPFNGRSRMHNGMDYAGPTGTPIYAVAGGVVSFSGRKGGFGNAVEVDHGNGLVSRYGHLSEALVSEGLVVKKGDKIALMGSTGRSTGSHLHLEILQGGEAIDPQGYLGLAE